MTSDAYRTHLYDEKGREIFLPGYRVDALADAAIRYVHRHRDTPFFLFVSFLEPHHQNHRDDYPAPRGYAEQYRGRWTPPDLACLPAHDGSGMVGGSAQRDLAGYCGMVKRLDEALGRIRDALMSLGLDENTVVASTSDHGCHFKTRNSEYKRSCHESSVRVPMAFDGPGFHGGGRLSQLISLIDVPPTLLDAAGISVTAEMQGRSFLPLLRGSGEWRDDLLIEISESCTGRALRTSRWKYGVTAREADPTSPKQALEYREEFLYDLESDPYELCNLSGWRSHRAVADWLRERLLRAITAAGGPAPKIVHAPEIASGQRRVDPGDFR